MNNFYEFKEGKWVPCSNPMDWGADPDKQDWTTTLKLNGFYPFASHSIGDENGFHTEVFQVQKDFTFMDGMTHMVSFMVSGEAQYFFTNDMLALIDLLHKLATISHAEQVSLHTIEDERNALQS